MRPTVAHLVYRYLPVSETFIYEQLRALQCWRPIVASILPVENLARFPVQPMHCRAALRGVRALRETVWYRLRGHSWELPRVFRQKCVQVLHAHFGDVGCFFLPLKRATRLPMVVSFYGYDVSAYPRQPGAQERYRRLFAEVEAVTAEGPHMRQRLMDLGCPAEKIAIVPTAVDCSKFTFQPRVLHDGEPIRILVCARLVEKKGVRYAIQAFARAAATRSRLELRIIGDGPLRAELEELAHASGVRDRIHFQGSRTHDEFREELTGSHIFMLTSCTAADGDEEGTPTVLIEALATGIPVVSTRHAAIPEVVVHEKSGYLAPERDSLRLADCLGSMADAPEKWAPMGEFGRAHVERCYSMVHANEAREGLYGALAAGRSL